MFYTTNYQRYLAELALFAFLVIFGLAVNSQTLIALGILVLSHCLPSLVLSSLRNLAPSHNTPVPTFYSNGFCSFREKEVVELISCALMIGVSSGLLLLSLQKITFLPLNYASKTTILGLIYIACELSIYLLVTLTSKNAPFKKPTKARVVRIVVAFLVIIIAHIEHQLLQELVDMLAGLSVLSYVIYTSAGNLLRVARKNIDYAPRGIAMEDVKVFLLNLPGVLDVGKIYFRRLNEIEHELGVHVSLEHFLLDNSTLLKEKIRRELAVEFGISSVTIELVWEKRIGDAASVPHSSGPETNYLDPLGLDASTPGVIALGRED